MQYQTNRMSQSRDITQKPDFGSNLSLNLDRKIFSATRPPVPARYHACLLYCKIRKNVIVQTRENPQDHSKMEFGDKNNLETAQYLKNKN